MVPGPFISQQQKMKLLAKYCKFIVLFSKNSVRPPTKPLLCHLPHIFHRKQIENVMVFIIFLQRIK